MYPESLFVLGFVIIIAVFFGRKYSYVRAMISISSVWLFVIFFWILWDGIKKEHLILMMPVIIYWQYRYIKFGRKEIFKDKLKKNSN